MTGGYYVVNKFQSWSAVGTLTKSELIPITEYEIILIPNCQTPQSMNQIHLRIDPNGNVAACASVFNGVSSNDAWVEGAVLYLIGK